MASVPVTIEQRIAAASQFNGAAPVGAPTLVQENGILRYAESAAGGLFEFGFTGYWLAELQRVCGNFGNAASVTIQIVTTDETPLVVGTLLAVESGGIINQAGRGVILAPDERIRIITTGASQAMLARCTIRPLLAAPAS